MSFSGSLEMIRQSLKQFQTERGRSLRAAAVGRSYISFLVVVSVTSVALAPSAEASGWTAARAATTVKAHYSTVDQKAYDYAKSRGLTDAMQAALHGAKPTTVTCRTYRSRFHCTATVQGSARIPPDYALYTATAKVTLTVTGRRWRIVNGYR